MNLEAVSRASTDVNAVGREMTGEKLDDDDELNDEAVSLDDGGGDTREEVESCLLDTLVNLLPVD